MRTTVKQKWKDPNELVVLIKPTAAASYKNVINVLDEMTIGAVKRYVLMEPTN